MPIGSPRWFSVLMYGNLRLLLSHKAKGHKFLLRLKGVNGIAHRPSESVSKKAVAPRKMSRNHWSQEYVGWLEIALIGVPNVVESPFNWESYRFRARALIGNLTG